MKNNGLIITLIILLTIIIFCLIMFLVYCLNGRTNFNIFGFGTKSDNVVFDKAFEMEKINSIEIKQDAGDIIIKETTNDYIQAVIYGNNNDKPKVNLNENKLEIDYSNNKFFTFLSFGVRKNDIVLYIPTSYSNEIKVKNDYGNCEITDLENATVDIDCDAGNVELGKIKNATIKCDCGNIEIDEILNKCNLKSDCGNVSIDKLLINEDSKIKVDLGNVSIKETNDVCIDADVDLGKSNVNRNNLKANVTLKVDCDCGNVNINN